jgi:hypothetical protein
MDCLRGRRRVLTRGDGRHVIINVLWKQFQMAWRPRDRHCHRQRTGILTYETLERGFEADRLTDARWACPAGAGSNLYPVCGGGSGHEQASAKLRCIESDEVAVGFGPPA